MEACGKCFGRGYFPKFEHINGGACFACNGTGDAPIKASRPVERLSSQDMYDNRPAYERDLGDLSPVRRSSVLPEVTRPDNLDEYTHCASERCVVLVPPGRDYCRAHSV